MSEDKQLDKFEKIFKGLINGATRWNARQVELTCEVSQLHEVIRLALTDEVHFKFLSTIIGVDLGDKIAVKYVLADGADLLVITVEVGYEKPEVPSITPIMTAAILYEREIHDMFGVAFPGHPNLARLVLSEDWPEDVYPLRKDYQFFKDESGKPVKGCLINTAEAIAAQTKL